MKSELGVCLRAFHSAATGSAKFQKTVPKEHYPCFDETSTKFPFNQLLNNR